MTCSSRRLLRPAGNNRCRELDGAPRSPDGLTGRTVDFGHRKLESSTARIKMRCPNAGTAGASVRHGASRANASFRTHVLRFVGILLITCAFAGVKLGEQPDADEGDGHREQRRVVVR